MIVSRLVGLVALLATSLVLAAPPTEDGRFPELAVIENAQADHTSGHLAVGIGLECQPWHETGVWCGTRLILEAE